MSLIKCPECNSNVSDQAKICSSCGYQLIKPKRSGFGKFVKWVFILFNLLMTWWLVGGMNAASTVVNSTTGASHTGAEIGTGIGMFMVITIWALGDIILGMFVLFTKPK